MEATILIMAAITATRIIATNVRSLLMGNKPIGSHHQPVITCTKLTIETLGPVVKYVLC